MMIKPKRELWHAFILLWLCEAGMGLSVNRTAIEKCGAAHASCLFASYDEEFKCFDDLWHLEVGLLLFLRLTFINGIFRGAYPL